MDSWEEKEKAVEKLKSIGFTHIHPEENGRIFLSNIKDTKQGDVHIHLVKKDSQDYKEKLLFRNLLRKDKDEAQKYQELKYKYIKEAKGDRNKYNKLKELYIEELLKEYR